MRLVSYGRAGAERAAFLVGNHVIDIERGAGTPGRTFPPSMREILAAGDTDALHARHAAVEARLASAGPEAFPPGTCLARREVRLGPPVPDPSKIICVGLNYRDHAREQGKEPPAAPLLFAKAPSAASGPEDPIRLTAGLTQVDYELELGVVIGRTARRMPAADAMSCVGGYVMFLDITDREAQYGDKQWFRGKSHDTFAPSGPWLLAAGAIDPHELHMRLDVNGTAVQQSSTAEMIHRVPELIEYITRTITLVPGDIIASGTPAGVGVFRTPPRFLAPGDRLRAEIDSLGVIETVIERES